MSERDKSKSSINEDLNSKWSYSKTGIDRLAKDEGFNRFIDLLKKTTSFSKNRVKLDSGFFANVIDVGNNIGLAISTDGVGTKIMLPQLMNKYDTIGVDCIAMNVNDILCVGATPIAMVDYIAVQDKEKLPLEEIGKGLYKGAEIADISIPAGEIAQVKEMIKGEKEGYGFDIVGTAVGLVTLNKIIIGQDINEGDIIIGLRSSGIHSNGLTLARRVLFDAAGFKVDTYRDELGRTIGEELLEPTRIYVPEIIEMLKTDLEIKALIHITGEGFLNLSRSKADCGYIIEKLPGPQPIFSLIKDLGNIEEEEMHYVFNMGIGFCIIAPESEWDRVLEICKSSGTECYKLGYAVRDAGKKVRIIEKRLVSYGDKFIRY